MSHTQIPVFKLNILRLSSFTSIPPHTFPSTLSSSDTLLHRHTLLPTQFFAPITSCSITPSHLSLLCGRRRARCRTVSASTQFLQARRLPLLYSICSESLKDCSLQRRRATSISLLYRARRAHRRIESAVAPSTSSRRTHRRIESTITSYPWSASSHLIDRAHCRVARRGQSFRVRFLRPLLPSFTHRTISQDPPAFLHISPLYRAQQREYSGE